MIFRILSRLCVFVAAVSMMACSGSNESDVPTIDQARLMFDSGNYDGAREACNKIVADSLNIDKGTSPTSTYFNVSLLLSKLYDATGEEGDLALAKVCYNKAMKAGADSVDILSHEISVEDISKLEYVVNLTPGSEVNIDTDEHESEANSDNNHDK